jgi:alpha-ribazole phosphatase/probable phosphoglycerate mutase
MSSDQPKITFVDLLRHGEAEGGGKYRGITDDPLTERGIEQMLCAVGEHYPWHRIVTSPLRRCAEFAQILSERSALPLTQNPAFQGWNFGAWEGKTTDQIMKTDADALGRFWQDPLRHPPPGGEPLTAIATRATQALSGLLHQHPGEHLLIVCHAVPIRCIIAKILHMPLSHIFAIEVSPGATTRLIFTQKPAGITGSLLFHSGITPTRSTNSTKP